MTDFFKHAQADNVRLAKSRTLTGAVAADTYDLIRIPKYTFVTDVWAFIETACSHEDITVGWKGNGEAAQVAGFMTTAIVDAAVVGLKRAQHDTLVSFEGKYFNTASGAITITLGTTWTAGKLTVLAQYHVIH